MSGLTDIGSHCLAWWNGISAKIFSWKACDNSILSCASNWIPRSARNAHKILAWQRRFFVYLSSRNEFNGHWLRFILNCLVIYACFVWLPCLAAVFTTAIQFDYNTIAGRIRELAFLNPNVKSLLLIVNYHVLLYMYLSFNTSVYLFSFLLMVIWQYNQGCLFLFSSSYCLLLFDICSSWSLLDKRIQIQRRTITMNTFMQGVWLNMWDG